MGAVNLKYKNWNIFPFLSLGHWRGNNILLSYYILLPGRYWVCMKSTIFMREFAQQLRQYLFAMFRKFIFYIATYFISREMMRKSQNCGLTLKDKREKLKPNTRRKCELSETSLTFEGKQKSMKLRSARMARSILWWRTMKRPSVTLKTITMTLHSTTWL